MKWKSPLAPRLVVQNVLTSKILKEKKKGQKGKAEIYTFIFFLSKKVEAIARAIA